MRTVVDAPAHLPSLVDGHHHTQRVVVALYAVAQSELSNGVTACPLAFSYLQEGGGKRGLILNAATVVGRCSAAAVRIFA